MLGVPQPSIFPALVSSPALGLGGAEVCGAPLVPPAPPPPGRTSTNTSAATRASTTRPAIRMIVRLGPRPGGRGTGSSSVGWRCRRSDKGALLQVEHEFRRPGRPWRPRSGDDLAADA